MCGSSTGVAQSVTSTSPPSRMVCVQPLKKDQFVPLASVEHVVPAGIKQISWKNSTEVNLLDPFSSKKIRITDGEVDVRNLGIDYTISYPETTLVVIFQSEITKEFPKLFLEGAVTSLSEKLPQRLLVSMTLAQVEYKEGNVVKWVEGEPLKVMFIRCR